MALVQTAQAMLCKEQPVPMGFLEKMKEKFPDLPSVEEMAADEDLMKFMEPTKTGRKKKTPEERRGQYDEHKCDARIWNSAAYDNIQCSRKKILVDGELKCFCKMHQTLVGDKGDGGWWLGKITEPRPEEPMGPPGKNPHLHVWNTDKDGNLVEKAGKAKKAPAKKKKEKKASEEMTLDELRALLAQKQRIEDLKEKEEEEEEGQEEKEEDDGVETVIVDGVEYQLNREDKIVIDPEDMEIMGTWNAEEGKIDFEDEEAEKKHQERV